MDSAVPRNWGLTEAEIQEWPSSLEISSELGEDRICDGTSQNGWG